MVMKMNNKGKAGNTLSFVLILLIIVSIISMAIVYSVSYTTTYRLNKSRDNYRDIILQNICYEIFNTYAMSNVSIEEFKETFIEKHGDILENGKYKLEFYDTTIDTLGFKISRASETTECILIEASFQRSDSKVISYELKRKGITKWK